MAYERSAAFLKATSSVMGLSDQIVNRHKNRRTDHEVDLAVVIGKRANLVPRQNALKLVAGYRTGLDITVRGSEERSMRKSFDIYTVLEL